MGGIVTGNPDEARRQAALLAMNEGWDLRAASRTREALACYEAACALLEPIPAGAGPAWRNSLGAAWVNRAELLLHLRPQEALEANRTAIGWLEPGLEPGWSPLRRNLAGAWANQIQGLGLLGADGFPQRWPALVDALGHCLDLAEPHLGETAEAGALILQALRHLVDSIGRALPGLPDPECDVWAVEAVGWVEKGLSLFAGLRLVCPASEEAAARLLTFGGQLQSQAGRGRLAAFFDGHRATFERRGRQDAWRSAVECALQRVGGVLSQPRVWDARSESTWAEYGEVQALRAWAARLGLDFAPAPG